jgi:hypothetical protein
MRKYSQPITPRFNVESRYLDPALCTVENGTDWNNAYGDVIEAEDAHEAVELYKAWCLEN